jgi:hypothetical protein
MCWFGATQVDSAAAVVVAPRQKKKRLKELSH